MQLEKSILINSDFQLQWEDKQDCYVLLYPEGMVQLSQSAGEILNLCDGKNSIESITELLEAKFKTEGLKEDIIEFIKDAKERNWVLYHE